MHSIYACLNAGSPWPAAAIPRDTSSEADEALGLTGVPGLVPISAPGAGEGLGVDGVFVAGAALGLTGVPGFVAVSPPVPGAALGLAA